MKSRHAGLMAATALTAAVAFSGMAEAGEASNAAYTVLYAFKGGTTDGSKPYSPVLDSAGTLYGTTSGAGASKLGTIFKITPHGSETVITNFQGNSPATDPLGGLIEDAAGNFYGTTYNHLNGYKPCTGTSCGSVFKLGTDHNLTVLHSFPASSTDGQGPYAGVIMDQSGNLYGTTVGGAPIASTATTEAAARFSGLRRTVPKRCSIPSVPTTTPATTALTLRQA